MRSSILTSSLHLFLTSFHISFSQTCPSLSPLSLYYFLPNSYFPSSLVFSFFHLFTRCLLICFFSLYFSTVSAAFFFTVLPNGYRFSPLSPLFPPSLSAGLSVFLHLYQLFSRLVPTFLRSSLSLFLLLFSSCFLLNIYHLPCFSPISSFVSCYSLPSLFPFLFYIVFYHVSLSLVCVKHTDGSCVSFPLPLHLFLSSSFFVFHSISLYFFLPFPSRSLSLFCISHSRAFFSSPFQRFKSPSWIRLSLWRDGKKMGKRMEKVRE